MDMFSLFLGMQFVFIVFLSVEDIAPALRALLSWGKRPIYQFHGRYNER